MVDLLKLRDQIDRIDREMIRLFEERMDVSRQVADFKIQTGKSVFDREREMDKLKKKEIEPNLERIWDTLEMGEDDLLVPFSIKDDEGKCSVWDMIEMMRAGELFPYDEDNE